MSTFFEMDIQRRNDLLNAALKEFSSKGYDHASTNVIAKEAGISKALMFHYVGSKKELFIVVFDYFTKLMEKEYYGAINYSERDIFVRLHQSYLLQIDLIKKYPFITELQNLSHQTKCNEINMHLETNGRHFDCYPDLFENIDETKFRKGLDVDKCKEFILWANMGFTNQILAEIRNDQNALNSENIIEKLDGYFDELRKVFYL